MLDPPLVVSSRSRSSIVESSFKVLSSAVTEPSFVAWVLISIASDMGGKSIRLLVSNVLCELVVKLLKSAPVIMLSIFLVLVEEPDWLSSS